NILEKTRRRLSLQPELVAINVRSSINAVRKDLLSRNPVRSACSDRTPTLPASRRAPSRAGGQRLRIARRSRGALPRPEGRGRRAYRRARPGGPRRARRGGAATTC